MVCLTPDETLLFQQEREVRHDNLLWIFSQGPRPLQIVLTLNISFMLPTQLESERLWLRKPKLEDAEEAFHQYCSHAELTRFLTWDAHSSLEDTRAYIRRSLRSWEKQDHWVYYLVDKCSTRILGSIGAHSHDGRAEVGYVLRRDAWGQGLTTEALRCLIGGLFSQASIYRIQARCDVENPASARVMEKSGMHREALLRHYMRIKSLGTQPRDMYLYAILKEDT